MPSWNKLVLQDLQFDLLLQDIKDMEPLEHNSPTWHPASLADTVNDLLLLCKILTQTLLSLKGIRNNNPRRLHELLDKQIGVSITLLPNISIPLQDSNPCTPRLRRSHNLPGGRAQVGERASAHPGRSISLGGGMMRRHSLCFEQR